MIIKYGLFIIVTICFLNGIDGFSQTMIDLSIKENDTIIYWTKNRKLKWTDFKSENKIINFGAAQSTISIMIEPYSYSKRGYNYEIISGFYKNKSWADSNSDHLLKHEQLHFDIAELFARKMRNEIFKLKINNDDLVFEDYILVHEKFYTKYRNYVKSYDLETDYSRIFEAQKSWEVKIANELEELEKFSLKMESNNSD